MTAFGRKQTFRVVLDQRLLTTAGEGYIVISSAYEISELAQSSQGRG